MNLFANIRLPRPQTTFWRFFLAATFIGMATATLAMFSALWIGRGMLQDLQENSGYTVLRNAVDLIGRTQIGLEEQRTGYVEARKMVLSGNVSFATALMESYRRQVVAGEMSMATARKRALQRLNQMVVDGPTPVFVVDSECCLAVHPDKAFRNKKVSNFQDAEGDHVFRDLVARARAAGHGQVVFALNSWFRPGRHEQEPMLTAAMRYEPWDVTVCSSMFIGDVDKAMKEKRLTALNELQARMREVVIGKSGYLYVLGEDCRMIIHPDLSGQDISELRVPGTGALMCREFMAAAERPWGENRYFYDWDKPGDRRNYVHTKVTWVTREPSTGWYVGASAYLDEIHAALPSFIMGIFLPSLGSILILGGALAILLRNQLRPIQDLARVCLKVSRGDLEVSAREDSTGEMGFLSRHFNIMIRRLRGLRQKEMRRRKELEDLNENLEKIVAVRTKALERKAHKLEEANVRLQELDSMKSAFLSSVSHELRTPLTSIRGFAKLIAKDFEKNFSEPARKQGRGLEKKARRIESNVGIIVQEGERLTRLINDVLDLARIESGQIHWRESELSLHEVVNQSMQAMSGVIAAKTGLEMISLVDEDLPPMYADMDRLTQVFINLMDNACKFTARGRVEVSACSRDGWIQARVRDTGPGISKHDLLKIFDKFQQAVTRDTLQKKPKGTGLGLAICHNITEHYGGLIWAESEPGKGTEFIIELPTAEARPGFAPDDDGPDPSLMPGRRYMPEGDQPLILVVDDEEHLREYLAQLFESEGWQVITAEDGLQALELAQAHRPDLITMDILMPGMNGEETMDRLRRDHVLRDIPIVVISALRDRKNLQGDAVLGKPVDETKLIASVRGLLCPESGGADPCLVLGRGDDMDIPLLLACAGQVKYCGMEELQHEIEDGFKGTVFVPVPLASTLDIKSLMDTGRVQVVVVPHARTGPES